MTLSRFLRDYLFIPLGGSRAGAVIQARNLIVTMVLGGLWHGAAWTFVVWGGLQGMALALNSAWNRQGWRMPAVAGWAVTTLFFVTAFVFFRAETFTSATHVLAGMAGLGGAAPLHLKSGWILPVAALAAVLGPTSQAFVFDTLRPLAWVAVPAGAVLAGLLLLSGGRVPNEFIYFRF